MKHMKDDVFSYATTEHGNILIYEQTQIYA